MESNSWSISMILNHIILRCIGGKLKSNNWICKYDSDYIVLCDIGGKFWYWTHHIKFPFFASRRLQLHAVLWMKVLFLLFVRLFFDFHGQTNLRDGFHFVYLLISILVSCKCPVQIRLDIIFFYKHETISLLFYQARQIWYCGAKWTENLLMPSPDRYCLWFAKLLIV